MATPQAQARLPAIPEPGRSIDPQTRKTILALKEALETRLGRGKTPIDAAVTFRDLAEGGFDVSIGNGNNNGGIPGNYQPPFINPLPRPDYSPPPAPTNVTTFGGFDYIFITWDRPVITGDYYTEIYRYTADNLGLAQGIGPVGFTQGPGVQYSDRLDNTNVYYYWARFVKVVYGTLIPGPFNLTAGTPGQITLSPSYIIDIIQGYITESELAQDLATRISLIDAADTVAGSVAERIKTERDARLAAVQTLIDRLNNADGGTGDDYTIEDLYADLATLTQEIQDGTTGLSVTRTELLALGNRINSVDGNGKTVEQFYTDYQSVVTAITDPQSGVDLTGVTTRLTSLEQQVFNVNNGASGFEIDARQFYTDYASVKLQVETNEADITTVTNQSTDILNRINTVNDGNGGTTTIESVVNNFWNIESQISATSTGLAARAFISDLQAVDARVDLLEGGSDTSVAVQRITALENSVNDPSTGLSTRASNVQVNTIQSDLNTLTGNYGSTASTVTQLSTSVGNISSALQITGSTSARMDGVDAILAASYTVKIDIDGYVIGYGIAGGSGTPSEFIVKAERFFCLDPTRSGTFVEGQNYATVQDLPDQFVMGYAKINGVTRFAINAPTYIPEGSIETLHVKSMDFSKITGFDINTEILNVNRTGWITNAMIGNVIQSTWPNSTSPSWKLDKQGYATFRGINIYHSTTGELLLSSGSGITWEAVNGVLPAEKIGFGLGVNMLNNTDFSGKIVDGWILWPPYNGSACVALMTEKKRTPSTTYYPPTGDALVIRQTVSATRSTDQPSNGLTACCDVIPPGFDYRIPVVGGKRYEFSAKIGTIRCRAALRWFWIDSAGNVIGSVTYGPVINQSWPTSTRSGKFIVAPSNAIAISVMFRKYTTSSGSDSYMWIHEPYFGAAGDAQTEFSPYSSGTNQGPLAAISQINQNNMADVLAPKSIDGITYIKDASVNTLQIRGQAVTFPLVLRVPMRDISVFGVEQTVGSVSWQGTGSPTMLLIDLYAGPPGRLSSTGLGGTAGKIGISVKHGSSLVSFRHWDAETATNDLFRFAFLLSSNLSESLNPGGMAVINSVAGVNTISIQVIGTLPSGSGTPYNGTISAKILILELRR